MPGKLYPSFEFKLLESLKPFLHYKKSPRYPIPIGDDAAIRACGNKENIVFTADTFVEDVHFSLSYMTIEEVGFKAMAINLSDCAAMAALPDGALVQIVFPNNQSPAKVLLNMKRLYKGLSETCAQWNFPIIGGNLSQGPCWIIDITLIGRARKNGRFLLRKGAKSGDGLWVTGSPGESGAGLAALKKWGRSKIPSPYAHLAMRHVRPTPRIEIGYALGKDPLVHALIDVSDGISKECRTLAFENNLGIVLDDDPGCVACPARHLAKDLKKDWQDWFLNGGEDYELLFAASPAFNPSRLITQSGIRITRIGTFFRSIPGVVLRYSNGRSVPLKKGGWDHLRKGLQ
jgi:thiamine-monophosphate kinase